MSTTTRVTARVFCPMHSGECGTSVVADFGTFADTTVSVEACDSLKAQGWGDEPQWVGRKSYAAEVLNFWEEPPATVRHRDGLVTFSI